MTRHVLLALASFSVLIPAMAAPPQSLAEARLVLEARVLLLTASATPSEAKELKALVSARDNLSAYGGGATKTDLKYLGNVVKAVLKAASPDPDVVAVLAVIRDHQSVLAAAARTEAAARVAYLTQEKNRQKVQAMIAAGDAALEAAVQVWPASPSQGAKGQAKAIATYQKAFATAEKLLAKEPAAGAVRYAGPPPEPGLVSFQHGAETIGVEAYPGEVLVVLDTPVPEATARAALIGLGGAVLSQVPAVGCYLVGVAPGQESAFINAARTQPGVYLAFPHLAGYYASTGVTVIDDCEGTHGEAVQRVLTDRGVTVSGCRTDGYGSRPVPIWTVWELEREVTERGTDPTLINISSSQGLTAGAYWEDQPEDTQRRVLASYTYDITTLLKAISQLPLPYRENLVVTLCAGNNHIPLDTVFAAIADDPVLLGILRANILVVGSKGQPFSNYATLFLDDFAWVNNPESSGGTSYAAPYALALVSKVMDQRGVSATAALRILKEAAAGNASHELLESEVLPVLPGDAYAGSVDGATTDTMDGSIWDTDVSLALLVTVSGTGILGDPYDVLLEFTGSLTETLVHCADPGGCDAGGTYPVAGTGQQTALGKVSVTALLDGNNDGFTVRLTDGVLSSDRRQLTGTVTVDSLAFDAPVTRAVTLDLVP